MNYKQNARIMQVTEKTLVVGVDIAKEKHYARAFNYRGIELSKVISFSNRTEGFDSFKGWVETIMAGQDLDRIIVGMEPTWHYWFNIGQYCKDNEIQLVLVNPYHVKTSKELDDNSPTKNDLKDPKTIAKLVIDGRYTEPYIPEGIYAELRESYNSYEHINKNLSAVKNQIQQWIDRMFPEYFEVFRDTDSKTGMMTLREFPLPEQIVALGPEKVLAKWREKVKRGIGIKRAEKLYAKALGTSGCKEGLSTSQKALNRLLDEYDMYEKQVEEVMSEMTELLKEIPGAEQLLGIKGIGIVSVAGLISEIGDISRFESAKQIIKYAGLNLVESSSGKHKGETRISKRGRKRLRGVLFRVMMPLVAKNEEFGILHKYYTNRRENPLKKKQSIILLCCKLIRVIYVLMSRKEAYDGKRLLKDTNKELVCA